MAAYDDLNTKRIFAVGILSVVVTAVSALAVQVVYYAMLQAQQERVIAESSYGRENGILDAQTAEISDYGVDPDTGNYTIPIDEAMKMLVADSPKEDHKADEPSHGADDHKDEETHSKKDDDTSESKDELSL